MSFALIDDDSDEDDVSLSGSPAANVSEAAASLAAASIGGADQRAAPTDATKATAVTSPGGTTRRTLAPQWARSSTGSGDVGAAPLRLNAAKPGMGGAGGIGTGAAGKLPGASGASGGLVGNGRAGELGADPLPGWDVAFGREGRTPSCY